MGKPKSTKGNTGFTIVKQGLTNDQFLIIYAEEFPNLQEDIFDIDYRGLIHLQIGLLSGYINKCIKDGQFAEVKRIFIFFEKMVGVVNNDIENALYVSFLEHINMDDQSPNSIEARKLLAPKFLKEYFALRNFS